MHSISVIITVFNTENLLERCLSSLLNQTFKTWEAILVDDGSTDSSSIICDQYAMSDDRFIVVHKTNQGVSAARETGLIHANGDFVIHLDPDDWIEPTMLEELYNVAVKDDADMVICDFFDEYEGHTIYNKQQPSNCNHNIVLKEMFTKLHGSCTNKLVRRSRIIEGDVHFPVGLNIGEDLYFNTLFLKQNVSVAYLPKAFYHYEHRQEKPSIIQSQRNWPAIYSNQAKVYAPVLSEQFPDIIKIIMFRAKRECLIGKFDYITFCTTCSEINNKLSELDPTLPDYKLVLIASRNRFAYFLSQILWSARVNLVALAKKIHLR